MLPSTRLTRWSCPLAAVEAIKIAITTVETLQALIICWQKLLSSDFNTAFFSYPARLHYYVIINWLDIEVDETAPEWRPLLNDLTGWRNREVYYYLQYVAPDWTARMYWGQQAIALFNVRAPSHLKAKWQRLRATGPKIKVRVDSTSTG